MYRLLIISVILWNVTSYYTVIRLFLTHSLGMPRQQGFIKRKKEITLKNVLCEIYKLIQWKYGIKKNQYLECVHS